MVVVGKGDASIATHAVSKVDAKTKTHPACVTVWAVKDGARPVVVEMAYATEVLCIWLGVGFAIRIHTTVVCRLKRITFHAHDLCHRISV